MSAQGIAEIRIARGVSHMITAGATGRATAPDIVPEPNPVWEVRNDIGTGAPAPARSAVPETGHEWTGHRRQAIVCGASRYGKGDRDHAFSSAMRDMAAHECGVMPSPTEPTA